MARVLVVEDDPDVRGLVTTRCRKAGHQVVEVADAAAALEVLAERGAPDVAVLDVGLPHVDGFELLGRIRALPGLADVPVIFLTARVLPADVERGRALGATYLTKPFVASALLAAIDRVTTVADTTW